MEVIREEGNIVEPLPNQGAGFRYHKKIGFLYTVDVPWDKDTGDHNYLRIRYHLQVGIKGTFFYIDPAKTDLVYIEDL